MRSSSSSAADLSTVIKAYDVRGVVPDQWGPPEATAIGAAMADVVAGDQPVVIGHDMRPSSPQLVDAFASGVQDRGRDVILIGLCSTDGLYYASGALDAPGAMFTASHNPAQYNGIKMCKAGAKPVGQDSGLEEITERAQRYLADGPPTAGTRGGRTERDMLADYAGYLRGLVDLSGGRELFVVVDAGNGMGGYTVPAVLGTQAGLPPLPLRIGELYFELDGTFPNHEANPLDPANLVDLQQAVRDRGADIGIAFDGDADRCFVVDENGEPVSPSAIAALVAEREIAKEHRAGRHPIVIHNLITSRTVPEAVTAAGGEPVRSRVGHSFIKDQMASTGAIFGGEHSAHYYFRDFWGADTGMLAAMHVLAALAEQSQPLSQLAAGYTQYAASGEINSTVADKDAAIARVEQAFAGRLRDIDTLDGTTFTGAGEPMWWFNVRPSNTEPLLRLNVEAADEATMVAVRDEVLALIRAEK
ncbi:MAG: phosphomannomutase/phosphoglucomutase [Micrococcales bacterium]|nr:MAG: phosphomannomutase/phosphoglucomutase [Micrococcales bacterium]PIE27801.1 MAG: phosphomannomutase/phosphoglucomutase [Micrococcales bacterium]